MKKFVLAAAIFFILGNAMAADVSWMYVQHRQYESGRQVNRLAFGMVDDNGHVLTDGSRVADVKLYAPGGKQLGLSKIRFDSDEEIFGLYNALKSQWAFSNSWQFDSWFKANFAEPLAPGLYRLKVTTHDGKIAEGSCRANPLVDLPVISATSFKFHPVIIPTPVISMRW